MSRPLSSMKRFAISGPNNTPAPRDNDGNDDDDDGDDKNDGE